MLRNSFSKPVRFGRLHLLSVACTCMLLLAGCTNSGEKIPDVSAIKVSLQTFRFDEDFSAIDTAHIGASLQKLNAKYPDVLNNYLDTFFAFGIYGNFTDTAHAIIDSPNGLKPFITSKDFVRLEDTIKKYYPDTKAVDAQLTDGFRYIKYYFPNYFVPKIIYVNMNLAGRWPTAPLDSTTIYVGLDFFLGDQFPFYAAVGVQPYMVAHMRKTYLPVSVFSAIYQCLQPFKTNDRTLLDLALQRGKEQYFLHKILPHTADSVIFGFPQHKLDWCAANEGLIYNFFTHQNLLYNKEPSSIMPYVYDGPFAANMPVEEPQKNTPGNIGGWMGYKIVCAYMIQNPNITLQQLLDQKIDPAKFLDIAKYRPK